MSARRRKQPPFSHHSSSRDDIIFQRQTKMTFASKHSHYSLLKQLVIPTLLLVFVLEAQPTYQQQNIMCPKACTCDEQIICKGNLGTSGLPHTLDPNAKKLIINNGQISQFNSNLDSLIKLESIDLSNNKLSSIDFNFITKNINLISFNTSHNSIIELKDTEVTKVLAEQGGSITALYDTIKSPKVFDSKVFRFPKIHVVDLTLSYNTLTNLKDFTFIRWFKLQRLDLSYNSLVSLEPFALFGLNKLEELNLQGNRMLQIPTQALHSTIHSLNNPLYSMSSSMTKTSSIKFLNLSENLLTYIGPNSFSSLEKVQELQLQSCSIKTIDEQAFNGLHTIQLLSLNHNKLQEVPSRSFYHLGLLKILQLNGNNILRLAPQDFSFLIHLEELQLNNCTFNVLKEGAFKDLTALKKLQITYNQNLTKIEKNAFEDMPNLSHLDLSSNSLTSLSLSDRLQAGLQFLDLRNNPLVCSCELKWLTKWLKNRHKATDVMSSSGGLMNQLNMNLSNVIDAVNLKYGNLTCSGPPALVGKQVIQLPENKLECLEPKSDLNVQLGFASLFFVAFIITLVCLMNFCRNKKHLFVMLKKNLVQNNMSMMMPYTHNLHENVDEFKKETQLYGSDYEPIDYQQHQAQIYNVHTDHTMYHDLKHSS